jgi:rRNA maturation protein Rpf1
LLTTSRQPTGRIRAFCRDLVDSIPQVIRINRGKMSQDSIIEKAITFNADRVIIVERWNEGFGKINFFQISSSRRLIQFPPLILISEINLRREMNIRTIYERSSVITMEPADLSILQRTAGCISKFLGLPILSLYQEVKNHHVSMHFSINSKKCVQVTYMLLSRMFEIGPRFSISQIIWKTSS